MILIKTIDIQNQLKKLKKKKKIKSKQKKN